MAIIDDLQKKKPSSFSDVAAPGVTVVPTGVPGGVPVPTAGIRYEQNVPATPMSPALQAALASGQPMGVVGQVNEDPAVAALKAPFRAIGAGIQKVYGQPAPAVVGDAGITDPLGNVSTSPTYSPAAVMPPSTPIAPPAAVAPAGVMPAGTAIQPVGGVATQAQVRAVDNNVANTAAIAAAPVAGAGLGAPPGAPTSSPTGGLADSQRVLANLQASNAAVRPAGFSGVVGGSPLGLSGDERQKFFDEAALRTAASQGSWSPRKGYQGNQAAVEAALAPINNRARATDAAARNATDLAATTLRDVGETARTGVREAGDTARANQTDSRLTAAQQQANAIAQGEFGIKQTAAGYDNASKARLEQAQREVTAATTPEARRAAGEKLAALQGKERQDAFKALELGGGQTVDPTTGVATQQPKSAILYNQATGTYQQIGGVPGAAAKPAVAEGSMSTSNGKPIRFTNGKWVPA